MPVLDDERGEDRGDLGRLELREQRVEHDLGGDELVDRVDLARDAPLERDRAVVADVPELVQHLQPLLIVGEEPEALVAQHVPQPVDLLAQQRPLARERVLRRE